MRKTMTKSAKVRRYLQQNPNAIPKDVGARFKCAMPIVYAIRKEVLRGAPVETEVPVQFKPFVPSTKADDLQIGGDHYKNMGIQPWKAMESWMTPAEFQGFLKGNAIKYLARCNAKGGENDLKKAHHYIGKLIEVVGSD